MNKIEREEARINIGVQAYIDGVRQDLKKIMNWIKISVIVFILFSLAITAVNLEVARYFYRWTEYQDSAEMEIAKSKKNREEWEIKSKGTDSARVKILIKSPEARKYWQYLIMNGDTLR